jgi:hypothetical protein
VLNQLGCAARALNIQAWAGLTEPNNTPLAIALVDTIAAKDNFPFIAVLFS